MAAPLCRNLGMPNIVLIGVPSIKALERVQRKLDAHRVTHYAWTEPDNGMGFTAIACRPVSGDERRIFENYRVYPHARSSMAEYSGSNPKDVGSSPTARANVGCGEASPLA
jgi:hypothetical protein